MTLEFIKVELNKALEIEQINKNIEGMLLQIHELEQTLKEWEQIKQDRLQLIESLKDEINIQKNKRALYYSVIRLESYEKE